VKTSPRYFIKSGNQYKPQGGGGKKRPRKCEGREKQESQEKPQEGEAPRGGSESVGLREDARWRGGGRKAGRPRPLESRTSARPSVASGGKPGLGVVRRIVVKAVSPSENPQEGAGGREDRVFEEVAAVTLGECSFLGEGFQEFVSPGGVDLLKEFVNFLVDLGVESRFRKSKFLVDKSVGVKLRFRCRFAFVPVEGGATNRTGVRQCDTCLRGGGLVRLLRIMYDLSGPLRGDMLREPNLSL
jgi:hypothetical protein